MILPSSKHQKITPPQLARRYGCKPTKVLGWIQSGELRAIDAATVRGGRPRYLIDEKDIEAFEVARAVTPPRPIVQRRRKTALKEFF